MSAMVPLLQGSKNYLIWSVKLKAWAAGKCLLRMLTTDPDPTDNEQEGDSDDVKEAKRRRRQARAEKDAEALGGIILRLAESEMHLALGAKTAK